ncbi:MAG: Cys-tRNA(Pro) deacylase [Acidimicrobiia bacterium]
MTPGVLALERAGIAHEIRTYELDPSADNYGPAAAAALGLDPAVVFKTLIVNVDGKPVVAVVPVTHQCGLKAVASAVGGKRAEMSDPHVAERLTGYVVGGISPVGQKKRLSTVIDISAEGLERMWVSAGKRGVQIGVAPSDLARITAARFAAITA